MVQTTASQVKHHSHNIGLGKGTDILSRVKEILQEKRTGTDISLIQSKISRIMSGQNPQKDKSTAIYYIKNINPELYSVLPQALQNDSEVIQTALKAGLSLSKIPQYLQEQDIFIILSFDVLIKKGGSLIGLIDFIETYSDPSTKDGMRLQQKLIKKLRAILQKTKTSDSYEQILTYLYLDNINLYKKLQRLSIFETRDKKVTLSSGFIKKIQDSVSKKGEQDIDTELIIAVEGFFEQHFKHPNTYLSTIQDMIIAQLIGTQKAQEIDKGETEEDDTIQVSSDETYDVEDIPQVNRVMKFSYYPYTAHGDYYSFGSQGEASIDIPRRFAESMSETSLKNYIKFTKLMRELGLDFLLSKHLSKIMIATDVNFFNENGMTESRTLRFLNSLGKNLGIPERSYQDPDSQEKLVGCFHTLAAAKLQFLKVKSSGYIGTEYIISPSDRGEKSIVEIALKLRGLIAGPYDEISLASWKR